MSDKEICESCGKPMSEHTDEWGRHVACVQSIMGTVYFHSATRYEEINRAE